MTVDTLSAPFFEALYAAQPDPWNFAGSPYELARYDAVMRALAGRAFERAFEPGCSVGVLTARLATVCAQVEAMDVSATAVRQAQARCAAWPGVRVYVGGVPGDLPAGNFDLVVLSEIGYYFSPDALRRWVLITVAQLQPGGMLLAAHWLGHSPDHAVGGDTVHAVLRGLPGLRLEYEERHEDEVHGGFRLDRWVRTEASSGRPS